MQLQYLDMEKIDRSGDLIVIYDRELNFTHWNSSCENRFGFLKTDVIGQPLLKFFPQVDDDFRVKCLRDAISEEKSFFFTNLPYLYSKGYYSQLILPLYSIEIRPVGVISIARDVEELSPPLTRKDFLVPVLKENVLATQLLSRDF